MSYRVLVVSLDFSALYLFTRKLSVALGFTVASNVYTTIAYLLHERAWDRITWGRRRLPEMPAQQRSDDVTLGAP